MKGFQLENNPLNEKIGNISVKRKDGTRTKTPSEIRDKMYVGACIGLTYEEVAYMIADYEAITEYLVERLVHSESERFSK